MLGLVLLFYILSPGSAPESLLNRSIVRARGQLYAAARAVSRLRTAWFPGYAVDQLSTDAVTVFFPENMDSRAGARAVLAAAVDALPLIARDFDMPSGSYPHVSIFVHPDRDSLRRVFGWSASQSASGVYWGGVIRVLSPAVWLDEADDEALIQEFAAEGPMVHELTHLMLDLKTNGNYEAWFSEGMAQWEERRLINWEWTDGEAALRRQPLPFQVLREDFFQIKNEALAYRQSLRMIDFIVSEVGEAGLHEIIELLAAGYDTETALRKVLHRTPAALEADFRAWIAR